MFNGNGFNSNSSGGNGGGGVGIRNNYDELNYPDLISASIQTCNVSQIPLLLLRNSNNNNTHASMPSSTSSNEMRIPPMPPPLSSTIIQRIEDDLKSSPTSLSYAGGAGSNTSSASATDVQSKRYTFEVEREILARDAERRWNESSVSTASSCRDNNFINAGGNVNINENGKELSKGGPVDAPADHGEEGEVEVDATGCPILSNASSSCGEFLRWGGERI